LGSTLRLAYRDGTVGGRLIAFSATDSGSSRCATQTGRHEFDLEFARPFLDTLPFAGRLTGQPSPRTARALALETDWSFRDLAVGGGPKAASAGKAK